jgi:hypothetical protein
MFTYVSVYRVFINTRRTRKAYEAYNNIQSMIEITYTYSIVLFPRIRGAMHSNFEIEIDCHERILHGLSHQLHKNSDIVP